jgi:3-oxoacyl-[acyl-carrier protein] reductase
MDSLNGKNALVTGAGKGIGRAIAIALAIEGVNLAILARTQQDLETLSDELRNLGVKVSILTADVGDMHAVDDAVEKAMQEIGNIDILVNNRALPT